MHSRTVAAYKSFKQCIPSGSAGTITPLWNVLDQDFNLLYLYLITCPKGLAKGPYCHTKRTGKLHLLSGRVLVHWRDEGSDETYKSELLTTHNATEFIQIYPRTEYTIEALEDSVLLNLCNYPWSPFEPSESIKLPK